MSMLDQMIAQLCQDVNNNNEEMEKRSRETDYSLMTSDQEKELARYQVRRNPEDQELAFVNKTLTTFKQRAEVSNLTDSFRDKETEKTESKTTRSLVSVTANFFRYNTILQASS